MADFYFVDTSALCKRYVAETGSAWLRGLLAPATGNKVVIARTTAVEMIAALSRRERGGTVSSADANAARADFRVHLAVQYQVAELVEGLAEQSMHLAEAHRLRGYDAIQLAAALEVNALRMALGQPALTLLCSDAELSAAAVVEGLGVDDPNNHPIP